MKRYLLFAGILAPGLACAGCGASQPEAVVSSTPQQGPVVLAPRNVGAGEGGASAYAGSLDRAELNKAIERYRITKNRAPSPFEVGAADLNSDGSPEAVVLFTGEDWCSKTGCSCVVFQNQQFGFRPVSHIVSVRGPVLAAPSQGTGWRDLIVKTGGGGAPMRSVRLAFGASGYPANALVQPEADAAAASTAEKVIGEGLALAADSAQAAPSGEYR